MEAMLEKVGFTAVKTVGTDPRHRTIMAIKPKVCMYVCMYVDK